LYEVEVKIGVIESFSGPFLGLEVHADLLYEKLMDFLVVEVEGMPDRIIFDKLFGQQIVDLRESVLSQLLELAFWGQIEHFLS
jgi:hypothetical protein